MFNHHFFENGGKKRVKRFLTEASEGILLLTDPPFGGMVEALAQSFLKLSSMWEDIVALPTAAERDTSSIGNSQSSFKFHISKFQSVSLVLINALIAKYFCHCVHFDHLYATAVQIPIFLASAGVFT